ncbi:MULTISPECIES: hypothetical protein [Bacillus]|uniref:hypothetical protein n=1 Tax=Bacillus TaxID=1386 RepID=UPI0002E603A6|nr:MULTISPECIES: hypothetical protein [Bacillus]
MTSYNSLLKRVKKLESHERLKQGESHVFYMEDGSYLEVNAREFNAIWDDVEVGKPNKHYEHLKKKLDEGYPDEGGLIHLMMAWDVNMNLDLWDDE